MKRLLATAALALALLPGTAHAGKHFIKGTVLDRNGSPVERVNVTVAPGNVEIITDETGTFLVDYLRDEEGNRTRLSKRTEYTVVFFKVGYHEEKVTFLYKRGELALETVTLKEETIKVDPSTDNIDPSTLTDRQQDAGGSYEGE
ncbi:MAG: carboxypeptidase-like regulatory domain-containing protein [Pseudomonadota bacterium]|nr:carboxypeptidase-like regulatory domain-containing protein [Pseudomonadota bacterium]